MASSLAKKFPLKFGETEKRTAITAEWAQKFFLKFGDAEERKEYRKINKHSFWTAEACVDLINMAEEAYAAGASLASGKYGALRDLAGIGYRTLYLARRGMTVSGTVPKPWYGLRDEMKRRHVDVIPFEYNDEIRLMPRAVKSDDRLVLRRYHFRMEVTDGQNVCVLPTGNDPTVVAVLAEIGVECDEQGRVVRRNTRGQRRAVPRTQLRSYLRQKLNLQS